MQVLGPRRLVLLVVGHVPPVGELRVLALPQLGHHRRPHGDEQAVEGHRHGGGRLVGRRDDLHDDRRPHQPEQHLRVVLEPRKVEGDLLAKVVAHVLDRLLHQPQVGPQPAALAVLGARPDAEAEHGAPLGEQLVALRRVEREAVGEGLLGDEPVDVELGAALVERRLHLRVDEALPLERREEAPALQRELVLAHDLVVGVRRDVGAVGVVELGLEAHLDLGALRLLLEQRERRRDLEQHLLVVARAVLDHAQPHPLEREQHVGALALQLLGLLRLVVRPLVVARLEPLAAGLVGAAAAAHQTELHPVDAPHVVLALLLLLLLGYPQRERQNDVGHQPEPRFRVQLRLVSLLVGGVLAHCHLEVVALASEAVRRRALDELVDDDGPVARLGRPLQLQKHAGLALERRLEPTRSQLFVVDGDDAIELAHACHRARATLGHPSHAMVLVELEAEWRLHGDLERLGLERREVGLRDGSRRTDDVVLLQ